MKELSTKELIPLSFDPDLGDDFAVLGLSDGLETDSTEEWLRSGFASLVHDIHVIESSAMGLIKKMVYGEPPNSPDLIFGFNVEPPKHRAKLLAHRSRIEARANERDYSIIFE